MPYDNIYAEKRLPSAFRQSWHHFYSDMPAMIGLYGFGALLLLCLFGHFLAPYPIDQQFLGYQLLPPSWSRYGEVSFFLGTDDLGRDLLSRLLNGVAPTVGSAIVVTLFATFRHDARRALCRAESRAGHVTVNSFSLAGHHRGGLSRPTP